MKKIFKNKTFKFIVKAAVSLGFVIYVIFKVNWNDVLNGIKEVEWWQTILYIVILLLGMLISSYKWKILTDYKGFNFSLFGHFKLYMAGTFINNFMPSFIGGDTYKAYQIGKNEKKYSEAASTVVADRITGLVGAMVLAVLFSVLNAKNVIKSDILVFINILIILSLLFDVIFTKMRGSVFWKGIIKKILPEKIVCFMREMYSYGNDHQVIKKSILLAMVFDIIGVALSNLILFWSLGISIKILDYMSVIFLISIVSSIPISINNIGVKEWSYIAFFGALGMPAAPVVTVAILSRVLQMIVSFFALPVYMKGKIEAKIHY